MKYVIITPVYNEENYIKFTLESVINQTLLPIEWIIVDDGSIDNSSKIIKEYIKGKNWIKYINIIKDGKEKYSSGANVARAVNKGIENISDNNFDFIVKLDADLTLPNDYFEKISSHFIENNKIGICGGICAINIMGEWKIERISNPDHVRGPIKSYRTNCFKIIGGIKPIEGWDVIDELLSLYNGFEIFVDEKLIVKHHRKTDTKTGNYKASIKSGKSYYIIGFNFFVVLIGAIKKSITCKPYFFSGVLAIYGYLHSYFTKQKKVVNEKEANYINKHRLKSAFKLKKIKNIYG
ncbi:MAG: glycosyltransferase family 2 protein [Bacteroidales bacterium]